MAIQLQYEVARTRSPVSGIQSAINAALHVMRRIHGTVDDWRAARLLSGMDDGMLKDIGVARGNIDWTVHNGRDGV